MFFILVLRIMATTTTVAEATPAAPAAEPEAKAGYVVVINEDGKSLVVPVPDEGAPALAVFMNKLAGDAEPGPIIYGAAGGSEMLAMAVARAKAAQFFVGTKKKEKPESAEKNATHWFQVVLPFDAICARFGSGGKGNDAARWLLSLCFGFAQDDSHMATGRVVFAGKAVGKQDPIGLPREFADVVHGVCIDRLRRLRGWDGIGLAERDGTLHFTSEGLSHFHWAASGQSTWGYPV